MILYALSRYVFAGVFGPIVLLLLSILIINLLQNYSPKILPETLKTWSWLPRPLRTLAWYDEHCCAANKRLLCCNEKESKKVPLVLSQNVETDSGRINMVFDNDSVDRLSAISTRF